MEATLPRIKEELPLSQYSVKATSESNGSRQKTPFGRGRELTVEDYVVQAEKDGFDVPEIAGNIAMSLAGMCESDVEDLRARLWELFEHPERMAEGHLVPQVAAAKVFRPFTQRLVGDAVVSEMEGFEGRSGSKAWNVAENFIDFLFNPPFVLAKAVQ